MIVTSRDIDPPVALLERTDAETGERLVLIFGKDVVDDRLLVLLGRLLADV